MKNKINKFDGKYAFLSNFYASPMVYNGIIYLNSEAAYQAQKEPARYQEFVRLPPGKAKRHGLTVTLRDDWNDVKLSIMRGVISAKFKQNPELTHSLINTGDAELIEGNWWHDTYWGVCNGTGHNMLGKLLMELRRELKNEKADKGDTTTMRLPVLFETQEQLDTYIVTSKKLTGINLTQERILALQVELAELANDWQGFKFWKENNAPKIKSVCSLCDDSGKIRIVAFNGYQDFETNAVCPVCNGVKSEKNPMLEEFVDCLHFLLSIGNSLGLQDVVIERNAPRDTATKTFIAIGGDIALLSQSIEDGEDLSVFRERYSVLFNRFVGLGENHLGFSWQDVYDAYFEKNKMNYTRQNNGY